MQAGDKVRTPKGEGIYECHGPLADECSVLIGEVGSRVRHIVKVKEVKEIEPRKKN